MSKSIYDEVLDILVDSFTDPQNEDYDFYMLTNNQMMKISKAIKCAKKQEKLLELYEALVIVKDDMLSYCEVVDDDYYDSKELATSFEKQIKEL